MLMKGFEIQLKITKGTGMRLTWYKMGVIIFSAPIFYYRTDALQNRR